jgi:histidyl-tRNA synthetase
MALKKQMKKTPVSRELRLQTPKGMHDVLPSQQPYWQMIREAVRDLARNYNFGRIDTPIVEYAQLFQRGVGAGTDIVEKEMYVFKTKGRDILALRPEGTASVMRSYMQHSLNRLGQPQKLFYEGPMFRHENPQSGRYRQFYQMGFEIIGGANDPLYDAQVVLVFDLLLKNLRIKNASLHLNSIGCRVCRPIYKRHLQNYYRNKEGQLCPDCKNRLKANPLRLLDCKREECQPFKAKAPSFLDKLCSSCSHHFRGVLEYLDQLGIPYMLDNQLVRGLDYYSRTVFEFYVGEEGAAAGALGGGGRYDYLAELLGGRATPAVGWAGGFERLVEVMKAQGMSFDGKNTRRVFVAHAGELAKKRALKLIEELHAAGIPTFEALSKESLKAQLRVADKEQAVLAAIVGQKEVYEACVILRDLRTGLQETFPCTKMVDEIKKRLKGK